MALNSITPAQHVVLGSCHLHQEIQFIGNDVFHILFPFADTPSPTAGYIWQWNTAH
ncbi:MAG: hypothetical protein J6F33_12405 [Acidaminococcaceae bacterium]|nr:hypothetical protein [Acidaminococcaceae bacterium]